MNPNEIPVDANVVINLLLDQIRTLTQENAVLRAALQGQQAAAADG